jgi:hypothetical protein
MSDARRYETDFHGWAVEQAALLRAGRLTELDSANLAEEVEVMGRGERRELTSRLGVLLVHLLKWRAQPGLRSTTWLLTIREQRRKLDRHLRDTPSLCANLPQSIDDGFGDALLAAQRETGLPGTAFPLTCPWTEEQILDPAYLPD